MSRPFIKLVGYSCLRVLCRLVAIVLFRYRGFGRNRIPKQGPVVICANHQSFFDPVIVGLTFNRRLNYLARQSLFRFAPFRWLIEFLDAIPLDREGLGMAGLKECLKRLERGEMVLLFPEGTRTRDGNVAALKPGFVALARRYHVSLLPVGVDGAFQAWPRTAWYPRLVAVHVYIGEPLRATEMAELDDAQLVAELQRRIRECHARARRSREQ